jgi:hypothetical protein
MAETTYYASVRESVAGANKRHLAVFNAVGSNKVMRVYRIVAAGTPTAAVAGLKISLAALRLTSAPTGGSALTFAKARTVSANVPSQVTVAAATTGGAVEAIAFGLGVVSGEETASDNESVIYEAPIDGSEAIELVEGEGFEVRQLTLAAAGAVSIVAVIGLSP